MNSKMNLSNILAAGLICAAGILPLNAVPNQSPAKKSAPAPLGIKATLRFCWWTAPEEIPVLAVAQENERVAISPEVMSMSMKTEYLGPPVATIVRQTVGPEKDKKGNPIYVWVPYASVSIPKEGADLAVLLIPRPKGDAVTQVFDFSEEAFPYGTIQFVNYTNAKVEARVNQTVMQIPSRGRTRYPGQFTKRQPANFSLEVSPPNEEPILVNSTTMVFFPNSRLLYFIIESPGAQKEERYHDSVIMENKVLLPPPRPIEPPAEPGSGEKPKSKGKATGEPAK